MGWVDMLAYTTGRLINRSTCSFSSVSRSSWVCGRREGEKRGEGRGGEGREGKGGGERERKGEEGSSSTLM